nr:PREDICTED: uncharacterized protein LOC109030705 isoform X2 [Bemisia tabaci]
MGSKLLFSCVCLVAINSVLSAAARAHPYSAEEYCKDLEPQKSMDLDQMMGLWYAVEVVEHRPNVPRSGQGTTVIDSCPVLHLAQTSKHTVRLLWSEKAGQIDYRFSIPDFETPGRWISTGSQNVSGTGQVLKVVHDHMVLSICLPPPNSQQFTVLMSRNQQLKARDILSVNNLLERKRLPLLDIRQGCSSATTMFLSQLWFAPFIAIALNFQS